ncbi:MAG: hypothetical protein QOH70_1719 [Blastocatellia bacterium]|jgi:hypothetical protein|nr:hypothetical protein [Blastocatellia bacterium]
MPNRSLDLRDFLQAASHSSNRTRTLVTILLVASVLAFVGFLDSYKYGWMLERLHVISNPKADYVTEKLGTVPSDEQYKEFYGAVIKSYVDNALTIRVPFFGFAFDVNDLGLLAGIGFSTLLLLLRFSLRSENVSIRLAFKAAAGPTLPVFYDLFAMQQVFTLPHAEDSEKQWTAKRYESLRRASKVICLLPSIAYTFILIHDCWITLKIGNLISDFHTRFLVVYTCVFWVAILLLAIWCLRSWKRIDNLWDEYWDDVKAILKARREGDLKGQRLQPATTIS